METHNVSLTHSHNPKDQHSVSPIGSSTYVINNSLFCSIQPKRTSFDVKLYLQLHKKLSRRAIIEKKFEESIYQLRQPSCNSRKGFRGKLRPDTFLSRNIGSADRQKRVHTSGKLLTYESEEGTLYGNWRGVGEQGQEKALQKSGLPSQHTKPNMMYNLSLYRKGFKRHDFRNEKISATIMNNLQRTRRVMTREAAREATTTYSNKLLTVVS